MLARVARKPRPKVLVRFRAIGHFDTMRTKADETEFDKFFAYLPVLLAVAFVFWMLLRKPTPPPPPSDLKGCFTSEGAQPISFDGRQVRLGSGIPPMNYTLTNSKNGLEIEFSRPVRLRLTSNGRWVFASPEGGWSYQTRLVHIIGGKGYGVWAVADAQYVEFFADNYSRRAFWRADAKACR